MDNQLQTLRRQLASGDTSVLPQIEAIECRMEGHLYRQVRCLPSWRATPRWIRVEVCERCLAARGLRPDEVPSAPPVFAISLNGRQVYHAAGNYANGYYAPVLCGSGNYPSPRAEHLTYCRQPVTCKRCLAIIERDAPRHYSPSNVISAPLTPLVDILADVSRRYYQHLVNLYPEAIVSESELAHHANSR